MGFFNPRAGKQCDMSRLVEERIVIDPDILVGKPVIRGTRIPVELVLKDLASSLDISTLLEAYPRLTVDDIRACIEYARSIVEGESIFPATDDHVAQTTA
jgi:uncharacterized protein (DUF433 family)